MKVDPYPMSAPFRSAVYAGEGPRPGKQEPWFHLPALPRFNETPVFNSPDLGFLAGTYLGEQSQD